jgi:hypothetical protein
MYFPNQIRADESRWLLGSSSKRRDGFERSNLKSRRNIEYGELSAKTKVKTSQGGLQMSERTWREQCAFASLPKSHCTIDRNLLARIQVISKRCQPSVLARNHQRFEIVPEHRPKLPKQLPRNHRLRQSYSTLQAFLWHLQ